MGKKKAVKKPEPPKEYKFSVGERMWDRLERIAKKSESSVDDAMANAIWVYEHLLRELESGRQVLTGNPVTGATYPMVIVPYGMSGKAASNLLAGNPTAPPDDDIPF